MNPQERYPDRESPQRPTNHEPLFPRINLPVKTRLRSPMKKAAARDAAAFLETVFGKRP